MIHAVYGVGPLRLLLLLIVWGGLIVLAVLLVRGLFRDSRTKNQSNRPSSAREILDQRYVRGEITRDEYELIKKDISDIPR